MQKILILSEFCCWQFKQIAKIEFGTIKSVESSMCFDLTWANSTGYTNINNVWKQPENL